MDFSQPLGKYHFDRDADGAVTTSELGTLVRSLGKTPSEADVVEMITQAGDNEFSILLNAPFHKLCISTFRRTLVVRAPSTCLLSWS